MEWQFITGLNYAPGISVLKNKMDIFGNSNGLLGENKSRKVNKRSEFDYSFGVSGGSSVHLDNNLASQKSISFLKILSILIFAVIFTKLFYSQIVNGKLSEDLANGNKIRPRVITAMRGVIQDNQGVWLARNVPTYDLAIFPSDLPKDKFERKKIYEKLATIVGDSPENVQAKAEFDGLYLLDQISLIENISHEQALLLEEKIQGMPAVFVAKRASREYKTLPGIGHLLGYAGKVSKEDLKEDKTYLSSDWIGKTGLEASYEKELRGDHGVEQIEVDSRGNIIRTLVDNNNREPVSGHNITLYLDSELQQKAGEFLSQGLQSGKEFTGQEVTAGVVVVMNPQNGGILAMVSLPDYNNNLFSNGISTDDYKKLLDDKNKPMFNRALNGTYPPGSTIKIMMAVAGLAEKVLSVSTAFDTPPSIDIGEWRFPDWKDHGLTNIERAIAESNNIFFYAIGGGFDKIKGLGIEKMKQWWQRFALGEKSGVDLPVESSGLLPDPAWKKKNTGEPWYIGDTYHAAIGQGDLLVTPIQMIKVVSAIANGGKLLRPQMVQKISDENGTILREYGPQIQNEQVAASEIIQTVQRGMRMTVTEGSARTLSDLPVTVAGKTGTAEFLNNSKTHAWFECYAPYENPEIAVVVLVEGGGGGHEIAVPVARNILQYYFTR